VNLLDFMQAFEKNETGVPENIGVRY